MFVQSLIELHELNGNGSIRASPANPVHEPDGRADLQVNGCQAKPSAGFSDSTRLGNPSLRVLTFGRRKVQIISVAREVVFRNFF